MYGNMGEALKRDLQELRDAGLYKEERIIRSKQGALIEVEHPPGAAPREVINFCANNYLGLSSDPTVIEAARESLNEQGFGMSSVRFICGTQDRHKLLESRLAEFLETEDTILYAACFDANGGVFEPLLSEEDVILTDQLNHASIIDGIRLCKARRAIYQHADMADLEQKLKEAADARYRLIATDGAFSMDGAIARLDEICDLADRYNALVMVDDCHATGFLGPRGRGSHEYRGVMGRVDIITGTFGKALGGASGGFVSGRREIVELLRQRSRPYLFSNTLAPSITGATLKVLDLLEESTSLRDKLEANTLRFRTAMTEAGFQIKEGDHPIVPIMLYDARLAQAIAAELFDEGIYVIGFSFPVVPEGEARIRVQLSASHDSGQVDQAVAAFTRVAEKHGVLS
ncbi:MAG: glycine C-acetyltransferase [Planctomycetota bacterium]|nr:glycine C-acetyltransferase [Planctomycetota bacterium]